jgi:hypothetical protein
MATNVYFSPKVKSEQNLYEDLVIESLKMYGQDVYYLPRDLADYDQVLNEDIESEFAYGYSMEMYIENVEGFEGQGNLLSKFGLELRDEATFVVAKRTWDLAIGSNDSLSAQIRPYEGDLIYLPLSKSFFEISFVEHEAPFYQLSNLVVYKLQARLFEFNNEDFDTEIEEIDVIEKTGYTVTLKVQINMVDNFADLETVYQVLPSGAKIMGEVSSYDHELGLLNLIDIATDDGEYHEFVTGSIITGMTSGATANVIEVFDVANSTVDETFANDYNAQNFTFEQEADNIIDFSESNPFGEPNQ